MPERSVRHRPPAVNRRPPKYLSLYPTTPPRTPTVRFTRILFAALAVLALNPQHLFSEGNGELDPTYPTTLSVFLPHSDHLSLDGPITHYILQNFATPNNIDFTWIPVSRDQLAQTLTTLLASGDPPDLNLASIPLTASFAQRGDLAPLDDLVTHYGSNITDTAWGAALAYGTFGTDTLWSIPRANNLPAVTTGWVMRQDWLDALGIPLPTTTESFLESVLNIKNNDRGGTNPDVTVIGINYADLGSQIRDIITSFLHPSLIHSPRERTAYGWGLYPGNTLLAAPGFLDGLRFLNNLNTEAMFPRDWHQDDAIAMYERYVLTDQMFTTGIPYTTFLRDWTPARDQYNSSAHWVPVYPFTARDGNNYKYAVPVATDALFVPATTPSESAINALKYLNWHADPTVHLWMRYGESRAPGAEPPEPRWYDKGNIMSCGPLCADLYRADNQFRFPNYKTELDLYIDFASRNVFRSVIVPQPFEADRTFPISELRARQKEWIARIILASPDQVDSLYASAIEDLNLIGMADYITRSRAVFQQHYPNGLPAGPASFDALALSAGQGPTPAPESQEQTDPEAQEQPTSAAQAQPASADPVAAQPDGELPALPALPARPARAALPALPALPASPAPPATPAPPADVGQPE